MKNLGKSARIAAAFAVGLMGSPLAATGLALVSSTAAHAGEALTLADMKQTLGAYGEFVTHDKYGEVWKPTVTPKGWHPYPACDWVYTKDYGWYFDDKTPWGAIVHHYGRWVHDEAMGWIWTPGLEFSPGWVIWKASKEWVGWAPQLPDVDMTDVQLAKFDDDKLWTFMDAKKFGKSCDGVATQAQYPAIYGGTTYVTNMKFVNGVGVFVLPSWIYAPIVNIDIDVFGPWSSSFVGIWVWNWTSIFNDIDINIINVSTGGEGCAPKDAKDPQKDPKDPVKPKPVIDNVPPPPPGGVIKTGNPNGWRLPPRVVTPDPVRPEGRRPDRVIDQTPPKRIPDRVVDANPGERFPGRGPGKIIDRFPERQPGGGFGGRGPGRQPGKIVDRFPQREPNGVGPNARIPSRVIDSGFSRNAGGRVLGKRDAMNTGLTRVERSPILR